MHFVELEKSQCDQMLKLKVAQIFPKVAPKIAKSVFIGKGMFFKIAPKSLYIWATFETKYFTQNFRKSPNLVTLGSPMVGFLPKNIMARPSHGKLYKV